MTAVATSRADPEEIWSALATLQSRRLIHRGIWRCTRRVGRLTRQGDAGDGGDHILDRALSDLRLLRRMDGDLRDAERRGRSTLASGPFALWLAAAPLAPLQRRVVVARLGGQSWPCIAASLCHGDRGSAVRAFRQGVDWLVALVAVQAVLYREPGIPDGELRQRLNLSQRRLNAVRRRLQDTMHLPPPHARSRPVASRSRPKKPNSPDAAELCPPAGRAVAAGPCAGSWYLARVRPGTDRLVKAALEREPALAARCRIVRRGRNPRGLGYMAVRCSHPVRLRSALSALPDVLGWAATGGWCRARASGRSFPGGVPVAVPPDCAAWFLPVGDA